MRGHEAALVQCLSNLFGNALKFAPHGDIRVLPNIDRFEGAKVFFVDGSAHEVDVVVYCTGYKVTFPFLDDTIVHAEDNHIDLYRRVVEAFVREWWRPVDPREMLLWLADEELVRRVQHFEVHADRAVRVHSTSVRGFASLPVTFRERAGA